MARDRTRHSQGRGVAAATSDRAMSSGGPAVRGQSGTDSAVSRQIQRILSCMETVAMLLETDEAFLPIFIRLERELEAAQAAQDALERSRAYLPCPD